MKKPANGSGRPVRMSLLSNEQRRKPPTLPRVTFLEHTTWIDDESLLGPSGDRTAPDPAMRRLLKIEDER